MIRTLTILTLSALLGIGSAFAQGSASIGRSAGVIHGQSWGAGQQDLHSYGTGSRGRPITRNQAVRQRAQAAARARARARARAQARARAAQRQAQSLPAPSSPR